MKQTKCQHPKCENMHKSSTGYCAEHVEKHERHRTYVREGRTCSSPHLVEEDTRGYMMPDVL